MLRSKTGSAFCHTMLHVREQDCQLDLRVLDRAKLKESQRNSLNICIYMLLLTVCLHCRGYIAQSLNFQKVGLGSDASLQ